MLCTIGQINVDINICQYQYQSLDVAYDVKLIVFVSPKYIAINQIILTMTMTMTMKITLLPCNTCSILSNDITLTGYIQQSINCIWKTNTWQRGQEAGAYVSQYHLKYLYKGAIGTKQCRCNGINYQFISYASHVIAFLRYGKSSYCSCYNIKRGKKSWILMCGNNHVYPYLNRQQILFWIQE